jgi:hypothetical protein
MLQAGISNGKPRRIPTRDITITPRAADEYCPVCESKGWCGASEDGAVAFCKRIQSDQSHGDWGWVHRVEGEPRPPKGERADRMEPIDVARAAREHAAYLETHPHYRDALDALLRLPPGSSRALPLIGVMPHVDSACIYTFAEVDADERVIGISLRHSRTGRKWMCGGSQRGIYIVPTWADTDGPVYLAEGASDVLALSAAGLPAIGRPSNTGGVDHLTTLLARHPGREIVVVGERDPKPDHSWPGRDGAIQTAERLAGGLGRAVRWTLPPDGAKDVRAWLIDAARGHADGPTRGRELAGVLRAASSACHPPPSGQPASAPWSQPTAPPSAYAANGPGLAVTTMSGLLPTPVRWLVPGYIPTGKLTLLAGDGGHGKSTITLDLTGSVTSGRCAFGMTYPDPVRGSVLLISCEDDFGDTVRPRLDVAGADLDRVYRVDGVRGPDGKVQGFNLLCFAQLRDHLLAHPEIALVVIDPAGAYIGGTGIDDHKDSELRALLGPLAQLAADTDTAVILVKHFNKGANAKAVSKVSGSSGYVNAVRAAHIVIPHPDDVKRKLLLPIKLNLCEKPTGLEFRLKGLTRHEADPIVTRYTHLTDADKDTLASQLYRVDWIGEADLDADDAVNPTPPSGKDAVDECARWLALFIGEYAWPDAEVMAAANRHGFKERHLKLAKVALRKHTPPLQSQPVGYGDGWWHWFGDKGQPAPKRPDAVRHINVEIPPETAAVSVGQSVRPAPQNPKSVQTGCENDVSPCPA